MRPVISPCAVLFVRQASGLRRAILEKSFSFRAHGTPVIGLRSLEICALSSSLRQLPDVLFVGRASLTGKRIAAGHIGKKLQFPRTRHSRDRIAELRNLRPVIIVAPTSRRASLAGKRIAAGHIGKKLQFPRTRHSRDRIAERAIRGGAEKFAPCHHRCARFPRACFL